MNRYAKAIAAAAVAGTTAFTSAQNAGANLNHALIAVGAVTWGVPNAFTDDVKEAIAAYEKAQQVKL